MPELASAVHDTRLSEILRSHIVREGRETLARVRRREDAVGITYRDETRDESMEDYLRDLARCLVDSLVCRSTMSLQDIEWWLDISEAGGVGVRTCLDVLEHVPAEARRLAVGAVMDHRAKAPDNHAREIETMGAVKQFRDLLPAAKVRQRFDMLWQMLLMGDSGLWMHCSRKGNEDLKPEFGPADVTRVETGQRQSFERRPAG